MGAARRFSVASLSLPQHLVLSFCPWASTLSHEMPNEPPTVDNDGAEPSATNPSGDAPAPSAAPTESAAPTVPDVAMTYGGDAANAATGTGSQPSGARSFQQAMAETLEFERLVAVLPSLATPLSVFEHKLRVAVREVVERLASLVARGGITRPNREASAGGRLQSVDRHV